jgi:hypothetical protein
VTVRSDRHPDKSESHGSWEATGHTATVTLTDLNLEGAESWRAIQQPSLWHCKLTELNLEGAERREDLTPLVSGSARLGCGCIGLMGVMIKPKRWWGHTATVTVTDLNLERTEISRANVTSTQMALSIYLAKPLKLKCEVHIQYIQHIQHICETCIAWHAWQTTRKTSKDIHAMESSWSTWNTITHFPLLAHGKSSQMQEPDLLLDLHDHVLLISFGLEIPPFGATPADLQKITCTDADSTCILDFANLMCQDIDHISVTSRLSITGKDLDLSCNYPIYTHHLIYLTLHNRIYGEWIYIRYQL